MNWKLRIKRWDFWIPVLGAIVAASGIEWTALTSWTLVWLSIKGIFLNPVQLCGIIIAVAGIVIDYTTEGAADSELAQGYLVPSPKTKED